MSVTIMAVYSAYSLLHGLLVLAGVGAAAIGAGEMMPKNAEQSLSETRKALSQKMLESIASEMANMAKRPSAGAWKRMNAEMETFRDSLIGASEDGATLDSFVRDFQNLRRRIREEELDARQAATRLEQIREKLHILRAKGIGSWEKELNRLEAGATSEQLAELSASERLVELQGILLELGEMERMATIAAEANLEDLQETRWVFGNARSGESPGGGADGHARTSAVREIRDLADRIAQMDETEGEALRPALESLSADTPFPDRLHDLRRQLRATWAGLRERVILTTLFREKLETLYSVVQAANSPEGGELARRCELLCGGKYIDRSAFMALYEDICRFAFARAEVIADNLFAEKVEGALDALGYELLTDAEPEGEVLHSDAPDALRPEQVRYLDSPYEGYRVMAKVGKRGTFAARLIRAVATEEEKNAPSEYLRQKDLETGRKWCRDFDAFLENLKDRGMPLDVTLRMEPGETEILVVVDRELAQKSARGAKKRRPKKTLAQKIQERPAHERGTAS